MIDTLARRKNFIVPAFLAVVVAPLALLLLIVGARSPYTHVNLDSGFDSHYMRSTQAVIGEPEQFRGARLAVPIASDPAERGKQLFVAAGCASCHGLTGREGIVGPVIAGTDAATLRKKTDKGPGGMPAYAAGALSDDDLAAIAAYLKTSALPMPATSASPTTAPTEAATVAPTQAMAMATAAPTEAATVTPTQAMAMPTTVSAAGGSEAVVNVVAKETDAGIVYTVDKSAVPAGKVKFVFKNDGKLTHELMVYPLQDISAMLNAKRHGQDVDEMDYIKDSAGSADDVDPGKTDSFEATLTPGFYELACHVLGKNKDGSSFTHFGKGQFFTLAVTGSGGPSDNIATPSNTVNVKMMQGAGDLASSWLFVPDKLVVKAGAVTFQVTNGEKEEHDFAVYAIGDTTGFVAMQLQGGMEPDYDAIHAQVVQANLEAGQSVTKTLQLTPGVYVAVCYMVSQNSDGTSFVHMERGQRFTFTVQ